MASLDGFGRDSMESVTFEKLKFAAQTILPGKAMVESLRIDQMWDSHLKQMLVGLSTTVLAHNFEDHKRTVTIPMTFQHPATWWDMLKRDHFPEWLLQRFPVRSVEETKTGKRTVTFKKYATYPEADIALPPQTFGFPVYRTSTYEELSDDDR